MGRKLAFILGCIGICVVCFGSETFASQRNVFEQIHQIEPEKKLAMFLINKNVITHKALRLSYNGYNENIVKSDIVRSIIEELRQYRKENLRIRMNEFRRMLTIENDVFLNSKIINNVLAVNEMPKMS